MIAWKADLILGVVLGVLCNMFLTITSSSPEYLGFDVFGMRVLILMFWVVFAFVITLLLELLLAVAKRLIVWALKH